MMKNVLLLFFFFISFISSAQEISRAAYLMAGRNIERTCYDVKTYDLSVKFELDPLYLNGVLKTKFDMVSSAKKVQFDLGKHLQLDSVIYCEKLLKFEREETAVWIQFEKELLVGTQHELTFYYQGKPIIAKNAPWDGGFVIKKQKNGKPFIGVACEELGASSWWPTKELLEDQCDSMSMQFEVPKGFEAISNGQYLGKENLKNSTIYRWKVTYPINNYNVSVTIGSFKKYSENYCSSDASFSIQYYVLPENYKKAKKQFTQTKPMLATFEKLFGSYPFSKDGFKIIESPYLGMEHQSGIAYGNGFENGYAGTYFAPANKMFDFILVHESGHEYWGNHVSMKDHSDMWIHEGFCTYSELLYVEQLFGKSFVSDYVQYWINSTQNKLPVVPPANTNVHAPTDAYYKGALLLHSLRFKMNDEQKFMEMFKCIQRDFSHQSVSTSEMINWMNSYWNKDLTAFFEHYLYQQFPPMLNFKLIPNKIKAGYVFYGKWDGVETDFEMPIELVINGTIYHFEVSTEWNEVKIPIDKLESYEFNQLKSYYLIKWE